MLAQLVLVFDLDGTLYPAGEGSAMFGNAHKAFTHIVLDWPLTGLRLPGRTDNGQVEQQRKNVFEFMHASCGLPRDVDAEAVWRPLFQQYNQTLRALRAGGFDVDEDAYWRFVRKDQPRFLKPDPELRQVLQAMPDPKW